MRAIPDLPWALTFRNVPANRDVSDRALANNKAGKTHEKSFDYRE
jgi:hypothetical protein